MARSQTAPNQMLPHDKEAEQGVLGAILHENKQVLDVSEYLVPGDFFSPAHRDLFAAMLEMAEERQPIDEITLSQHLKSMDKLEQVGGLIYIAELGDMTPVSANVMAYAEIVAEKSRMRSLIVTSAELSDKGRQGKESVTDLIGQAEEFFKGLSSRRTGLMAESSEQVVEKFWPMVEAPLDAYEVVPTYSVLDDWLGGFAPDFVSVIGARSGNGKTAFGMWIALQNARRNRPVLVVSMEMKHWQCAARAACTVSGVSSTLPLRRQFKRMKEETLNKFLDALSQSASWPLHYVGDGRRLTLGQIRFNCRRYVQHYGVRLIVVDHLRKINVPGPGDLYNKQTERIEGLSEIAKEVGVPIICLAQINRAGADAPAMKDLEGSGAIEQEGDIVMLLHKRGWSEADDSHMMDVMLEKHRNGPAKALTIKWSPACFRFQAPEVVNQEQMPGVEG